MFIKIRTGDALSNYWGQSQGALTFCFLHDFSSSLFFRFFHFQSDSKSGELGGSLAWAPCAVQVTLCTLGRKIPQQIPCRSRDRGWKKQFRNSFSLRERSCCRNIIPQAKGEAEEGKMNESGKEKEQEMSSHPHRAQLRALQETPGALGISLLI